MKKFLSLSIICILLMNFSLHSSAATYSNFNRTNASNYALKYAETPNTVYKLINADCTNFVSQAIAHGGVKSYISSYNKTPVLWKDWINEDNSNAWYMIKKTRFIGDYWVYSNSWAFVGDFHDFHITRAAKNSNFSGKLTNGTPNTTANVNTNFEYKLRKNAKVGQVWQLDNKHSVIITKVTQTSNGYNYVWYSGHTNNVKNSDIQNFLDYCWGYKNTSIHSLDFTA